MEMEKVIKTRRSIRKFTDEAVSDDIIRELIECAVYAPSACNSQCWKFVAIKDEGMIKKLSEAVADGYGKFYDGFAPDEKFLSGRINQGTFFRNAPLVICVFMTEMRYHDKRVEDVFVEKGYSFREMDIKLSEPDVLTIGAAVQNLLLAAHEKGLGACWMNDPVLSSAEICSLLDIPENERLMSVIPIGYPNYTPREKELKPMSDILTII